MYICDNGKLVITMPFCSEEIDYLWDQNGSIEMHDNPHYISLNYYKMPEDLKMDWDPGIEVAQQCEVYRKNNYIIACHTDLVLSLSLMV